MIPALSRYKAESKEPRELKTQTIHHDDLLQAFASYQRVVLIGEPGMGKTTSLHRIAMQQAERALNDKKQQIPVIIPLNEWTDENETLDDFIARQLGNLQPHFQLLLEQQRLMPLLDALNEVPASQRQQKLPQVEAWLERDFPYLLLTCRERDYKGELEQALENRLTIEPLDAPRIHTFLHNYFEHCSSQGKELADKLFWQLADDESLKDIWKRWKAHQPDWKARLKNLFKKPFPKPDWDSFWTHKQPLNNWFWENCWWDEDRLKHINNPRSMLKLAENPYLLTLIANIYQEDGSLPNSRKALFEHFATILLGRERIDKEKLHADIPEQEDLQTRLKSLAWALQSQSGKISASETRTTLSRAEAEQIMGSTLEFAAAASLLDVDKERVRFTHQLLQEFYAAQRFAEKRRQGLKASELWPAEHWWQSNGWEEVAKIAVEYEEEPRTFLTWLAEGQPTLAYEIANEQNCLDEPLFADYRKQWQASITDIVNHPNPHDRHEISTLLAKLDWDDRPFIGIDAVGIPEIDWVEIPAGEFIYQNGESLDLEAYKISRYPITHAQFQAFVDAGGYEHEQWWQGLRNDGLPDHRWQESNRPVENVSWYDAIAYCRWLSSEAELNIQLPTEQQWEKAARGDDGREYPWGEAYQPGFANVNEGFNFNSYIKQTSAVGIYPQAESPYGVLDMSGNVWEWCLNKYANPQILSTDFSNDFRVRRGGS